MALTRDGSVIRTVRPGATWICSSSAIDSSAPAITTSSGAPGRRTGGKSPSAGTVMNAYELTPPASGETLVSRYGRVRGLSPSVTITVPLGVTSATSDADGSTETLRSDSGPLGLSATSSTFTSTESALRVSVAGTTTSRAIGARIGASGSTSTVSTALSRPPRSFAAV